MNGSLIFPDRVESALRGIEECLSDALINAVCFYGRPGTGKTTYAKILADKFAKDVIHFDCAIQGVNNRVMDSMSSRAASGVLPFDVKLGRPFDKCFILDEFHNLNFKDQSRYKMLIEEDPERVMFVICLNVTATKSFEKSVESAIRSRCESVSFDIPKDEVRTHARKVQRQFPSLPLEHIEAYLPDMRTIKRKAQMNR